MRTQWILLSLNLLATPLLWTGPAWSAPAIPEKWPERAVVSGLDGSAVRFSVPDGGRPPGPLELAPLGIREPQWIGVLDSEAGKPPYLLVSGLSSESPERAVFLVRADGRIRPQRVTLPGRLLDPKNRELVFESRLFFGRCLGTQKYDAIVSYQRERLDRKRGMQSSVYIAEASPTMLDERLMERSLPRSARFCSRSAPGNAARSRDATASLTPVFQPQLSPRCGGQGQGQRRGRWRGRRRKELTWRPRGCIALGDGALGNGKSRPAGFCPLERCSPSDDP